MAELHVNLQLHSPLFFIITAFDQYCVRCYDSSYSVIIVWLHSDLELMDPFMDEPHGPQNLEWAVQ
jgi:hypothetical protein